MVDAPTAPPKPKLRSVKLRLTDGTELTERHVWNTSLGGVFVEMRDPLPFGTELNIEFILPREGQSIRCEGFVVWSTQTSPQNAPGKQGVGIRLINIGIKEMRQLAEAVARSLGG